MPLDLWFREDVARILASAWETMRSSLAGRSPADPEQDDAYRQGFEDALRSVGIAFGIATPSKLIQDERAIESYRRYDGT